MYLFAMSDLPRYLKNGIFHGNVSIDAHLLTRYQFDKFYLKTMNKLFVFLYTKQTFFFSHVIFSLVFSQRIKMQQDTYFQNNFIHRYHYKARGDRIKQKYEGLCLFIH